ncbi:MAG TPA: hypothetical protein VL422_18835 [Miltoncostaea sp.]|nr:hypothetical protein [Miltoncostaea sp.]
MAEDIDRYREQYAAELRGEADRYAARTRPAEEAEASIGDRSRPPGERVAAIAAASPGAVLRPELMDLFLGILRDRDDDPAVRLAALAALQENSFAVADFGPWAAAWTEVLRDVATDDDRALRTRALDLLALEGDEYAQRLLTDGLRDPRRALVPAAKALRMIGYDVHAEQYDLLRDLAANAKQKAVRNHALRLLAADASSKDMFARIAADRGEDATARATAAVALQGLAPEEFAALARDVVHDDDDDDRVRATVITALAHGPGDVDAATGEKVRALAEAPAPPRAAPAATRQLRTSAKHFMRVTEPE